MTADPRPPIGRLDRGRVAAVLFDLDGTLFDSDDAAIEYWRVRLRPIRWAFPGRNPAPFLRRLLMSGEGLASPALAALDVIGLTRVVYWLRRLTQSVVGCQDGRCATIFGVEPLLWALHSHYKLGIVTTRPRAQADSFLQRLRVEDLFAAVVTQESTRRLKPSPEPVRRAARILGVDPSQCVLVGDTVIDVLAAKRAGAQAVGVLCGIGSLKDLRGADLILASTSDLASHLL